MTGIMAPGLVTPYIQPEMGAEAWLRVYAC